MNLLFHDTALSMWHILGEKELKMKRYQQVTGGFHPFAQVYCGTKRLLKGQFLLFLLCGLEEPGMYGSTHLSLTKVCKVFPNNTTGLLQGDYLPAPQCL